MSNLMGLFMDPSLTVIGFSVSEQLFCRVSSAYLSVGNRECAGEMTTLDLVSLDVIRGTDLIVSN